MELENCLALIKDCNLKPIIKCCGCMCMCVHAEALVVTKYIVRTITSSIKPCVAQLHNMHGHLCKEHEGGLGARSAVFTVHFLFWQDADSLCPAIQLCG